jgi:predicted dehydrogenase/flavin reductase (DIM6/NTAB) family NADH-FMN oxidoreductase RutF
MISPARTAWDTKIQCVCAIVAARGQEGTEIYLSGNFGQVSLDPPRIIINPNRLYPMESIVREVRRFSLGVMPRDRRNEVLRLTRLRRREPRKAELLGWNLEDGPLGIPFLPDVLRTLFCEVESILETGDHTVMIARVIESRANPARAGQIPLLYQDVAGFQDEKPRGRLVRRVLLKSGLRDTIKKTLDRLRPPIPPDLPGNTYRDGGQTDDEVERILAYGVFDRGRILQPSRAPAILRRPVGICVVGTRWGAFHCELVKKAAPAARLFVCGQDSARTERLAHAVRAEGWFNGFDRAVADSRVQSVSLALPHHLHRAMSEAALAAGKHVLVEKPIATNLEDADAMLAAARRAGRILMVAEDMHFRPAVAYVARRIDLGDIGEPLHLLMHVGGIRRPEGWAAEREKLGGGVFMDIGVHYVRAMRLLFGEPASVLALTAMQVNTKITGEDNLRACYSGAAGWTADLFTTWSAKPGILPDIAVLGDRGTYHLWPRAKHVDYYPAIPTRILKLLEYVRPYRLQARLMRPSFGRVRVRVPGEETTGYVLEFREFLNAVVEEREPATTARDARRDLEIVVRTYESLARSERVGIGSHPPC